MPEATKTEAPGTAATLSADEREVLRALCRGESGLTIKAMIRVTVAMPLERRRAALRSLKDRELVRIEHGITKGFSGGERLTETVRSSMMSPRVLELGFSPFLSTGKHR